MPPLILTMYDDLNNISTPCFVVDEELMIKNLKKIKMIEDTCGCHILLAQKCFSTYQLYPLMREYLSGVTSSSLFEAELGYEEMGKEVHIFAPAYPDSEFDRICKICDHIVFNSFSQWEKYKTKALSAGVSCGIRINPMYSEIEADIYNPCIDGSRFGVSVHDMETHDLTGIEGIHFHTMCEQNSDTLFRTLNVIEAKFGKYMSDMKWINFGGGHHIARDDYDTELLIRCINKIRDKYNTQIYLEPGEGIAMNSGFLVSSVMDIVSNGVDICILDASAACHMPDVLEMPYRPPVHNSAAPGEKAFTYRLGGNTCLAGDIIGDYSFDSPLRVGDRVIFEDMSIYSMVKTNMFNGINLPSIAIRRLDKTIEKVKVFGYEDFKSRL